MKITSTRNKYLHSTLMISKIIITCLVLILCFSCEETLPEPPENEIPEEEVPEEEKPDEEEPDEPGEDEGEEDYPVNGLIFSLNPSDFSEYNVSPTSGTTISVEDNILVASSNAQAGFTITFDKPIDVDDLEMLISTRFKIESDKSIDYVQMLLYGEGSSICRYSFLQRDVPSGKFFDHEVELGEALTCKDQQSIIPGHRIGRVTIRTPNAGSPLKLYVSKLDFSFDNPLSSIGQEVFSRIQKEISNASPGQVFTVPNGNYNNVTFIARGSGRSENPITIKAENPGQVIISGHSQFVIAGEHITFDGFLFQNGTKDGVITFSPTSEHCKLTNSAIINWNTHVSSDVITWVYMHGKHNIVNKCFFRDKRTQGRIIDVVRGVPEEQHMLIENNYFGYIAEGTINGRETVRLNNTTDPNANCKSIVRLNFFDHASGENEIVCNKSNDNKYINNTFYNSKGCLSLRIGNRALVEGNIFAGKGNDNKRAAGVNVSGEDHIIRNNYFIELPVTSRAAIAITNGNDPNPARYDPVKNVEVSNNTIINSVAGISVGTYSGELTGGYPRKYPPHGEVNNNFIYTSSSNEKAFLLEDPVSAVMFSGNVVSGNVGLSLIPSGITNREIPLEAKNKGLFFPKEDVGANPEIVAKAPLSPNEFLPGWIRSKIDAKDPDFKANSLVITGY